MITLDTRVSAMINPFEREREYRLQKVDSVRRIEFKSSPVIEAYQKYQDYIKRVLYHKDSPVVRPSLHSLILSPEEINSFVHIITGEYLEEFLYFNSILEIEKLDDRVNEATGHFISRLVQVSYEKGNNDFKISIDRFNIDYLLNELSGTEDRPIKAEIIGNVGRKFCSDSDFVNIRLIGDSEGGCYNNTEYSELEEIGNTEECFGFCCENSILKITGNADYFCGAYMKNSSLTNIGNVRTDYGNNSFNSGFILHGDGNLNELGDESENCHCFLDGIITLENEKKQEHFRKSSSRFTTTNRRTYNVLKEQYSRDTDIKLIDSSGKIIKQTTPNQKK